VTDRAYARISFDALNSGSIDKQRHRIAAFAGDNLQWYEDRSVSGAKVPFGQRPEGLRLLRDLQPGDRVLVTKIDRAARSVRDLLDLVEQIAERGGSIVFVDQNIDTAGPMGRFLLTLLGAIAELEAGIVSERRRESLEVFAKEGRHAVGKAPFGFESVENPNGRGLVIALHPQDAPRLRTAIERVMAGETQEEVRHSIGMSKTGFHHLLKNPRLAGMTPDGDGVVMIEGVPRVNPDAALLSMAEWTRLAEFMQRATKKAWTKRDGYGAALRCAPCGKRLYKQVAKKVEHSTYCCDRTRHKSGESAPAIMVHVADAYLEEMFLKHYGDKPYRMKTWVDEAGPKIEATAAAQVRLEAVQKRLLASSSTEEDEMLTADLLSARRALRDAEALPSTRAQVSVETGLTFADLWRDGDDEKRCVLLQSVAVWEVQLGRGKVDKRITFGTPM
jgi:DNA invertase Pin-like site-specific DNA recombinase